jgi:hypothetical protein
MSSQNDKENSGRDRAAIITGIFVVIGACITGVFLLLNTLIEKGTIVIAPSPTNTMLSATQTFTVPIETATFVPQAIETPYIPSSVASEPMEVHITATDGWQDTKISIKIGDYIKIRHKAGLWQSTENELLFGPDPNLSSDPIDKCFPLPSDPGALIGMIGNYEPFKVGYSYETNSNIQGKLFLRMNDCDHWLYNNRDEFEDGIIVLISVLTKP